MKTSTVNHLRLNHRPSEPYARSRSEQWLLVQLEGERQRSDESSTRGVLRRLLSRD